MSALPRLQKCSCRLATVQRMKAIGVRTDDGECVDSPELRLLRRDLITVANRVGRDAHSRFSESKPQRNSWAKEPRLSARAGRSGVATPPTVERSESRQRTVRKPVTWRVVIGWGSRGLRWGTVTVVRLRVRAARPVGLSNTIAAEVEH